VGLAGEGDVEREGHPQRDGRRGAPDGIDGGRADLVAARIVEDDRDDQALALAGDRQPGTEGLPGGGHFEQRAACLG
jgi:hypothetical protein